jgi:hypothetical protein
MKSVDEEDEVDKHDEQVIPVLIVDNLQTSIVEFETRANDLRWLPKLAEIYPTLKEAYTEKLSMRPNLWDSYLSETGMKDKELKHLRELDQRDLGGVLSQIPLASIKLDVSSFQMRHDKIYRKALTAIRKSPRLCFLVLDVHWGGYTVTPSLLTARPIKDLLKEPENFNQEYLGAWNLAWEFLSMGGSRYVLKATTAGGIYEAGLGLTGEVRERLIDGKGSVGVAGAPAKIVELLSVWFKNHYASPVNRLRWMSEFWSKEDRSAAAWFSNESFSAAVPHNFPVDDMKRSTVSDLINKLVKVPSIESFCYEGFKSFALPGRNIGPETLYACAILAAAQKDLSALKVHGQHRGPIPVLKNGTRVIEGQFDFAETLFNFFKGLLKRDRLSVSFELDGKTLRISSSRHVAALLNEVKKHLNHFNQKGYWLLGQHTDSLPLAQCVENGKWGLVELVGHEAREIRKKEGPFVITMQDKEIRFGWEVKK